MNFDLVGPMLSAAQLLLALAMAFSLWRLLLGPRAHDRVLALDTLYVNAMLLILNFGIVWSSRDFFEVALVIGMLGFVSTAAAARFLLRGEVIE
jgi:multicomponent K+:H+ antiporter subunit F